jgi:carboxyl-terminal processing protease
MLKFSSKGNRYLMEAVVKKIKIILIVLVMVLATLACSLFIPGTPSPVPTDTEVILHRETPTASPTVVAPMPETPDVIEEPTTTPATEDEPVQVKGEIEVSNAQIVNVYYYERFAMLEDLTGFVNRDYEYIQPLEAQVLGPVTVNEDGEFSYTINLPAEPNSPLNDVDRDFEEDSGVQIWQVVMNANYMDDPFLSEDESGGWSASYSSAKINAEYKNEIIGGMLLIWAPDNHQEFPNGFGEDELLFTDDDPTVEIPSGYTIVNLDEEPFQFMKEKVSSIPLYEGELTVNDYSEMGWAEAFEALHNKISLEYPFTEVKEVDWDSLYESFAPLIESAELEEDTTAYFLALRDYAWSIPDGHVGMSYGEIGNEMFEVETAGGFGFAITGLEDERVIASIISEDGPAANAGMELGAEILEWDGHPINEAVEKVIPWSMPFSTQSAKRYQQYRYLLRAEVGTEVEVKYRNPGNTITNTAILKAIPERDTFAATSVFVGYDFNALPVEYKILPSGYGYIKINSLSEDINLIIRLWEWALERMINLEVPAIIIDLRQNSGGSPLGTLFAGYFVEDRLDVSHSYYFSEVTGDFETFGPPNYTEPDDDYYYDGQLAVLVGPACASACENVAYVLSLLEQTRVFGFYPSSGMYGEVARGQYILPGDYSFQIPTGLSRDMDGNIIIEGTGVPPDVFVPLTEENILSQYADGQDVVLNFTIENLNKPIGAGIEPEHSPTMGSVTESEAALQSETNWLDDLAQEEYSEDELSQAGRVYTYTVPMYNSEDIIWAYAWCTADEESFEDNWSKIELELSINGELVQLEDFAELEGVFSGNHCRLYYTVLKDWVVGEHIITTKVTFTGPINDGIVVEDFPAGTHIFEYHVYVGR